MPPTVARLAEMPARKLREALNREREMVALHQSSAEQFEAALEFQKGRRD